MAGIVRIFGQKRWAAPAIPTASFVGQTIIVTGANSGLGFEAAARFAEQGASRLILAVRSADKGNAAKQAIERRVRYKSSTRASNSTTDIQVWSLDMLSYPSIRSFAERATKTLDRIDIAILNAGVFSKNYELSGYGWEKTLQVNTLSTVLLSLLLLPKLRASATTADNRGRSPVLELVSSGTHRRTSWTDEQKASTTPLEAFNTQSESWSSNKNYAASKLFLMCALPRLMQLGTQDPKREVVVTSVCPGLCQSDLPREVVKWWMLPLLWVVRFLFMRTAEQGARTLVSGALLGKEGRGRFWQHDTFQPIAPLLDGHEGQERAERVWHEIVNGLRKDVPEVLELVRQ